MLKLARENKQLRKAGDLSRFLEKENERGQREKVTL